MGASFENWAFVIAVSNLPSRLIDDQYNRDIKLNTAVSIIDECQQLVSPVQLLSPETETKTMNRTYSAIEELTYKA